ncbi:Hemicentin-1, partial [Orchesella cincta]
MMPSNAEQVSREVVLLPSYTKVTKIVNDSYRVTCISNYPNDTFWFNPNGQKLTNSPDSLLRVEVKSRGVDLHFIRISHTDEGAYKCVLLNGSRSRVSFDLNVIHPIVYDKTLQTQIASEGQPYLMKCVVLDNVSPRLLWSVDGQIPDKHEYRVTKDGLQIFNVSDSDTNKQFTCRAVNSLTPFSQSNMLNITLKIRTEPRQIGNAKVRFYGIIGEWTNLTCSVKAVPDAKFEWFYRARLLENSRDIRIISEENKSTLQVFNDDEEKFGDYACRAINELGHLVQNIQLLKGEKPLPPILRILSVASDEVKISAKHGITQMGASFPILDYTIQYKPHCRTATTNSENYWVLANGNSKPLENEEGFVLSKLSQGTAYCIRAALRNTVTVGYFSPPVKVITPIVNVEQVQEQASARMSRSFII